MSLRVFVIFNLIWVGLVFASPNSRWGLIVNKNTSECSQFWEGNECERVIIPEGWTPLFPEWFQEDSTYRIKFSDRTCYWSGQKPKECCEQLGLKFNGELKAKSQRLGGADNPDGPCFQR